MLQQELMGMLLLTKHLMLVLVAAVAVVAVVAAEMVICSPKAEVELAAELAETGAEV